MQNSLSRKSSTTWKQSTTFSPADTSQSQIIKNVETFKDFFACKTALAADYRYPGNVQNFFHLQKCFRRRSSTTWKYSKTFSPADLSWPQVIDTPKTFKDIFTCRSVLAANHQQHGIFQRLFHLQTSLSRNSSTIWKYSNTFSPAELSQLQIINNLEIIRNIFACKIVLPANHQYLENIHRLFRLQNCLGRRSSITRRYSKTFSAAELS